MANVSEALENVKAIRDRLKNCHRHLADRDAGAAVAAIERMSEESDCEACEKIETDLLFLLRSLQLCPRPRREDRFHYAKQEVDWYLERYEEKVQEGEEKLEALQNDGVEA